MDFKSFYRGASVRVCMSLVFPCVYQSISGTPTLRVTNRLLLRTCCYGSLLWVSFTGLFYAYCYFGHMDFARHEQAFIEDVLLWVSFMGIFYGYVWDCDSFIHAFVTHSYLTWLTHGFAAAHKGGFFLILLFRADRFGMARNGVCFRIERVTNWHEIFTNSHIHVRARIATIWIRHDFTCISHELVHTCLSEGAAHSHENLSIWISHELTWISHELTHTCLSAGAAHSHDIALIWMSNELTWISHELTHTCPSAGKAYSSDTLSIWMRHELTWISHELTHTCLSAGAAYSNGIPSIWMRHKLTWISHELTQTGLSAGAAYSNDIPSIWRNHELTWISHELTHTCLSAGAAYSNDVPVFSHVG